MTGKKPKKKSVDSLSRRKKIFNHEKEEREREREREMNATKTKRIKRTTIASSPISSSSQNAP